MYCQIDRKVHRNLLGVDLPTLHRELELAMDEATSGRLWQQPPFSAAPMDKRRINDIAFSGDGEPTCLPNFDEAVAVAAGVLGKFLNGGAGGVKLIVITNATQLHSPQFHKALPILDAHNGEIWAKLDAGTEDYFQRVNRPYPRVTLRRVQENILAIARGRPIVIQSLFFRIDGIAPPESEVAAYIDSLKETLAGGGRIKLVQIHTIARPPGSAKATALADADLDTLADRVRTAIAPVPVEVFYG
jgi:wyosine [tRNA(Phe)-imidazoG37] synthetase (radical SAM superfamily)